MTTRAPFSAPTPETRIAQREAEHLGQSRRARSRDHKATMAARAAAEHRRTKLEQLKDEAAARRSFRKFERTMLRNVRIWKPLKLRLQQQIPARPRSKDRQDFRSTRSLPSIGFDVIDSKGRRGVFLSIEYDGASRTGRGVFRRRIEYALNSHDVVLGRDGRPLLFSNVAKDADEAVALADEIEAFARAERLNAKVCFNLIIGYPRAAGAKQRDLILRRFTQRVFADKGLSFFGFNHEPKRAGKVHNPHGHITASLRPVHREGPYSYLISKDLRVDLDGPEGMERMRKILAEVTTQVMREAGFDHVYTHLSNAARGIAVVPQEKLAKEQSEAAKRGEIVAANERNRALVREVRAYVLGRLRRSVEGSQSPLIAGIARPFATAPKAVRLPASHVLPKLARKVLKPPLGPNFVPVQLRKTPAVLSTQAAPAAAEPTPATALSPLLLARELIATRARSAPRFTSLLAHLGQPRAGAPRASLERLPTIAAPVETAPKTRVVGHPIIAFAGHLPAVCMPKPNAKAVLVSRCTWHSKVKQLGGFPLPTAAPYLTSRPLAIAYKVPPLGQVERLLVPTVAAIRTASLLPKPMAPLPMTLLSRLVSIASAPCLLEVPTAGLPTPVVRLAQSRATRKLDLGLANAQQLQGRRLLAPTHKGVTEFIAGREVGPLPGLTCLPRVRRLSLADRPSRAVPIVRGPLSVPALVKAPSIAIPQLNAPAARLVAELSLPKHNVSQFMKLEGLSLERSNGAGAMKSLPVTSAAAPISRAGRMSMAALLPQYRAPRWGSFEQLQSAVEAVRAKFAAEHQLEPTRASPEVEKAPTPAPQQPSSQDLAAAHIEHLQRSFLLAKSDEERRKAAVQIRRNKEALAAMNAHAHPLWTAEQTRFRNLQGGPQYGHSVGR